MQDYPEVQGIVIKSEPYAEFDRRVVLLTRERGKITCFAKGARKMGSRFMAATNPFSFGTFKLFEGKNAYSLNNADITEFFEGFRDNLEAAYYGMYFLELSDYYTRENNDEKDVLLLLYFSLKALISGKFPYKLIKSIFEIKILCIEGEYTGLDPLSEEKYNESTVYALEFIRTSRFEKLFTFTVSPEVLNELSVISDEFIRAAVDRPLKSAEFLTIFE